MLRDALGRTRSADDAVVFAREISACILREVCKAVFGDVVFSVLRTIESARIQK